MVDTSSTRRRFLATGAAAGAGMASVAGCLGFGGGSTSTISLAFTVPVENIGSLFAVEEIRDTLDNLGDGYELEVTRNASTPDSLNQMAAGEVDVALLTTVSYASAVQEEAVAGNISMVATDFWDAHPEYYGFTIYARGDSDIEGPEDLEGKNLGVNALGTGIHAIYNKKLEQVGLDPESDVNFVELGFPSFTTAINDGRFDVGIYPALFAVQARGEGFKPVFTSQDTWDEEYPFAYLCAANSSLEDKGAAFEAWGEDYVNLVDYIYDNRSSVVTAAAEHFELPEALVDGFFLTNDDYYRQEVAIDYERLQFAMDEMESLGFIDSSFDVQEYATNDYLPQ